VFHTLFSIAAFKNVWIKSGSILTILIIVQEGLYYGALEKSFCLRQRTPQKFWHEIFAPSLPNKKLNSMIFNGKTFYNIGGYPLI